MADAKNAYLSMDKQKSFIILSNFKFLLILTRCVLILAMRLQLKYKVRDLNNCCSHVMIHCCFYGFYARREKPPGFLREFSPNYHIVNPCPWLCFCSENSQLWPAIFLWHLLRSRLLVDNFLFELELFESSSFDVVPHLPEHLCC